MKLKYLLSVWLLLTAITFLINTAVLGHYTAMLRTAFMSMLWMFWPSAIFCLILEGVEKRRRAK